MKPVPQNTRDRLFSCLFRDRRTRRARGEESSAVESSSQFRPSCVLRALRGVSSEFRVYAVWAPFEGRMHPKNMPTQGWAWRRWRGILCRVFLRRLGVLARPSFRRAGTLVLRRTESPAAGVASTLRHGSSSFARDRQDMPTQAWAWHQAPWTPRRKCWRR